MIKTKRFRAWPRRPRLKNGYDIDDWRAYFDDEEREVLKEGHATDELERERRAFWTYAKNERNRLKRLAERKPRRAPLKDYYLVTPPTSMPREYLTVPRRVSRACARYWFYAHVLPRAENRPSLSREAAIRILNLNEADAARWLPEMHHSECVKASARVLDEAIYPCCGIPMEMAEKMQVEPDMRWRREMSAEPPPQIRRLIGQPHEALGMSVWYYRNLRGQRAVYGWRYEFYAGEEARVERKAKEVAADKADYRSKLLGIFD